MDLYMEVASVFIKNNSIAICTYERKFNYFIVRLHSQVLGSEQTMVELCQPPVSAS